MRYRPISCSSDPDGPHHRGVLEPPEPHQKAIGAHVDVGPREGLVLFQGLAQGELDNYHLAHAARKDLLRRLGRAAEARDSSERALASTRQEPEQRFPIKRLEELQAG